MEIRFDQFKTLWDLPLMITVKASSIETVKCVSLRLV